MNMACYVGHSAIRRTVMGEAGSEREATADEIEQMRRIVADAMEAGAAGFSSSHGPTQLDGDDVPVPSRFSSMEELETLCREAGMHRGRFDQLPAPQLDRRARRRGQGAAVPARQGLAVADHPPGPRRAFQGRRARRGLGLGRRNGSRSRGAKESGSTRCCATTRSTVTSTSSGAPTSTKGFLRGTRSPRRGRLWRRSSRCSTTTGLRAAMRTGVENPNKDGAKGSTLASSRLEGRVRRRGGEARARQVGEPLHRGHRRRARVSLRPTRCSTSRSTRTCRRCSAT